MTAEKLRLTMFVHSDNSGQALSQLYRALEFHAYTDYELVITNVFEDPLKAQSNQVSETPTLVRHTENGDISMVGDLSDVIKVRTTFGFRMS